MPKSPPPPIAIFQSAKALERSAPPSSAASFDADYARAADFLLEYRQPSATFNAYRREIERLCLWAWRIEARSVLELTREDITRFVEFLKSPPTSWIGTKTVARLRKDGDPNPDWRPFVVSVKKARLRDEMLELRRRMTAIDAQFEAIRRSQTRAEREANEAHRQLLARQTLWGWFSAGPVPVAASAQSKADEVR